MPNKREWFWIGETSFFTEFVCCNLHDLEEGISWHGPFDTFTLAKKDAIDYYRTDIWHAKEAIAAIQKTRKSTLCKNK